MCGYSRNFTFLFCALYRFTNNILSTAQQVWLQKLGGAKIPVIKFSDDIEKELPQIQKSVSEINSAKKELKQIEKLTSEGLRPGERLTFIAFYKSLCF